MTNTVQQIFKFLDIDPASASLSETLLDLRKDYPYFPLPHLLSLYGRQANPRELSNQYKMATLFCVNSAWLAYQTHADVDSNQPPAQLASLLYPALPQQKAVIEPHQTEPLETVVAEAALIEPVVSDYFSTEASPAPLAVEIQGMSNEFQEKTFSNWLAWSMPLPLSPETEPDPETLHLSETDWKDTENAQTETMANLLATQGKHLEAIQILETLIEQYPNKNPYFAAKILQIKSTL